MVGRRLATEAAAYAMAWAVTTFDLVRVWAATDARNVRSIRVMEKLGLTFESRRVAMQPGRVGECVEEVVWGVSFPKGTRG